MVKLAIAADLSQAMAGDYYQCRENMRCELTDRLDSAESYVRGQLSAARQDEFEIHILECRDCLETVDTLNELQFELRTRAHVIRQAPRQRNRVRNFVVVIAVALLVALVSIATRWMWGT